MKNALLKKDTVSPQMLALLAAVSVLAIDTVAGTGGASSSFDDILTWLTEVIQGTLGAVVCSAMILVGIIAGIARQSLMAFAIGIGGGVGLYNTPDIINGIFTATIQHAPTIAGAVTSISNGM